MTRAFATDTQSEIEETMASDENAVAAVAAEPAPVASSGRHRSAKPGRSAKAPKSPKAPKAPKSQKAPKVPKPLEADESSEAAPALRRRRSKLRPLALPAVAIVTVAAFVAALLLTLSGGSKHQQAPLNKATRAAMSAANTTVKDILGYDYRQIDSDVNTAKHEITGQLLTDYTSTAKKVLVQSASTKAIVTATVSAQSIVQAQTGRVTVLLYVDQESVKQLAGAKTPTTRIDPLRIQLTMTEVHGRWLASDLESI
jgi:Mce-associated membrane protein